MTSKARSMVHLEEREGYTISHSAPAITAEIAMQASSHSEALLRGKEQLNGYELALFSSVVARCKFLTKLKIVVFL